MRHDILCGSALERGGCLAVQSATERGEPLGGFLSVERRNRRLDRFACACGVYRGAVRAVDSILNHTLTPYGVLIFCMVYTRRPEDHKRMRDFKLGLFLPVLAMLAQVF